MVTRAIIDEVIEKYKYKIRIPKLNKTSTAPANTTKQNLYTATVSTLPNCNPNFQVGDAVFVAFEDNQEGYPVIIGQLARVENTELNAEIICSTIDAKITANLPSETYIGEITPYEIKCLMGVNKNLQSQIEILEQRVAKLEEEITKEK